MENKLQTLTEKLLQEGLQKGKNQGQEIVEKAKTEANAIIEKAKAEATAIIEKAKAEAAELHKNTQSDVKMASLQTISALKTQIQSLITMKVGAAEISKLWSGGEFLSTAIIEALKSWNPTLENPVVLSLPKDAVKDIEATIQKEFKGAVELNFEGKNKVPFRIEPKEGGYFVDFTEQGFQQLLQESLRPKVTELLFGQPAK